MAKAYWLMKSEEEVYSINHLEGDGVTYWEGVRNYEARNMMQKMAVGDEILFYHSNAKPPGVAGIARVAKEAYPDHFAFDPKNRYFDAKSDESNPRWFMVDVEFVSKLPRLVGLGEIREEAKLSDMALLNRKRLSVQPVTAAEFKHIVAMSKKAGPA